MTIQRRQPGRVIESELERYPFLFECDNPECTYRTACRDIPDAETQMVEHACPRKGTDNMTWGKSLLEKAWEQIDEEVVQIMALKEAGKEVPAHVASHSHGKAEILALFMQPHFNSAREISAEALRRYKIRQTGEEPITPGVGEGRYILPENARKEDVPRSKVTNTPNMATAVPSPDEGGYVAPIARQSQEKADAREVAKTKYNLTDEQVEKIKAAVQNGLPASMLATAYKVPVNVINELLGS